jgi:transketolase
MTLSRSELARTSLANAIRALSMDAVELANSGHPGAPMGMADIAEVLWNDYLQHNPADPQWPNRDRFVLSNGHGSMLLYALLHLSGYDLSIDDIKNFRQLHSKTPGHPEYGYTPGVETTTGPLGQGLANAVGMALAERTLAAQFNQPGFDVIDHHTYCFVGDGCLMEGISHEVASFAGTLGLGKLIVFYDDNGISIDGQVKPWFADDTAKRFDAYGWHVIPKVDGHDPQQIIAAIEMAKANSNRPSLLCCQTIIGFGAPTQQGTAGVHGKALGKAEIAAARECLQWPHAPFVIPENIQQQWSARQRGAAQQAQWQQVFNRYQQAFPEQAQQLLARIAGELPPTWPELKQTLLTQMAAPAPAVATRVASQQCLNVIAPHLPQLLGGSADLTGSNNTLWKQAKSLNEQADGQYIYYGVREFGMTAMMNGMALYGGFIPFGGTFLVFMDYARNAVRMAALMKQRVILIYSHDSIGLGEDGPTHQPVEHLSSLRSLPNMTSWRPADAYETAVSWVAALEHQHGPTALILSRQNLAALPLDEAQRQQVARGAYVLAASRWAVQVIIIATGSEVGLALTAHQTLTAQGVGVQLVSMPCADVFDRQTAEYQQQVLPKNVRARVAVEAAATDYWRKYVGLDGDVVGMHGFGESAPAAELYAHFELTVDEIVARVQRVLAAVA